MSDWLLDSFQILDLQDRAYQYHVEPGPTWSGSLKFKLAEL